MNTPLNPDAVRARIDEFLEGAATCGRFDVMEGTDLLIDASKALAAALPEVTSVEELEALPIGSVILDADNDAGIVEYDGVIFCETNKLSKAYVFKHYRNLRVLYRPEGN